MLFSRDWLSDYADLPADAAALAAGLTSVGLAVEGVEAVDGDAVLDVEVTTNRPDAMCHLGLAREAAVRFGVPLRPPAAAPPEAAERTAEAVAVEIEDAEGCPRYVARVVRGVEVGPSPDWLARRLRAIGLRPINNVVDVTNYVLWESGQPLHGFDLAKLAGGGAVKIVVRRARNGERMTTLDEVERELSPEVLVIADAERAVALAGIMGGLATEVGAETRDVLIESAHFDRRRVRLGARELGMHTDASHRFERGADPGACRAAADRAAALLAELAGGTVLAGAVDARGVETPAPVGRLDHARLEAFAGVAIDPADVERWLGGLGFALTRVEVGAGDAATEAPRSAAAVNAGDGGAAAKVPRSAAAVEAGDARDADAAVETATGSARRAAVESRNAAVESRNAARKLWQVTVPTWRRYDLPPDAPDGTVYEQDLFEEVIRHLGFDRIPATLPGIRGSDGPPAPERRRRDRVRDHLAACGWAEAIDYAFHSAEADAALPSAAPAGAAAVAIANPLSERYAVLRRSLLPNLVEAARFNLRRGAAAVRLFEVGHVFWKTAEGGADEHETVALVAGGRVGRPWDRQVELDLFDVKGVLESLAEALGTTVEARPADDLPGLTPGAAAELLVDGRRAGVLGRLDGGDETAALYVAELATAALGTGTESRPVAIPSRHPAIAADLTLVHPRSIAWAEIAAAVEAARPADLARFELAVRYTGEGVPEGAVATTLSFLYASTERSLTQEEVNERQEGLRTLLEGRFGRGAGEAG